MNELIYCQQYISSLVNTFEPESHTIATVYLKIRKITLRTLCRLAAALACMTSDFHSIKLPEWKEVESIADHADCVLAQPAARSKGFAALARDVSWQTWGAHF